MVKMTRTSNNKTLDLSHNNHNVTVATTPGSSCLLANSKAECRFGNCLRFYHLERFPRNLIPRLSKIGSNNLGFR